MAQPMICLSFQHIHSASISLALIPWHFRLMSQSPHTRFTHMILPIPNEGSMTAGVKLLPVTLTISFLMDTIEGARESVWPSITMLAGSPVSSLAYHCTAV
jgi:hypothetical protein